MTRRKKIWLGYFALLIASHIVTRSQGHRARPEPDQRVVTVFEARGTNHTARKVEIAYHDLANTAPDAPVVLFVHGSPSASFDTHGLAYAMSTNVRVIVPDLPGFGKSTRKISDYSFIAHADYLLQLLDVLNLSRVHVIAYSMGGGAAITLADRAPDRIASLTMLSAVGVQELELTGDYRWNHAIHGAQLLIAWLSRNLLPHFGVLDDFLLNYNYCRNFYDSDQRPLRAGLEKLSVPMLILHGRNDPLVPPAAPVEHHRIVPQSEIIWFDGGHIEIFTHPNSLATNLLSFIARVERGDAVTRTHADIQRVKAAANPFDSQHAEHGTTLKILARIILVALAAIAFAIWIVVKIIVPLFSYRGRRLLLGRWRRLTRWEFWPTWAIYPPVVFHILRLGFRHRGLGTFATCNPAIPAGGFLGESKSQILEQIKAREFVARFAKIKKNGDAQNVRDFMTQNRLTFPVVIKPDWGQRGLGVAIVRDDAQLEHYFAKPRTDCIVQEFAPGEEFGVFYFRHPDQPRGKIFSITEKVFTAVTGDSHRTLERLILADDRAVCSAKKFFARHRDRLDWVPAAGEKVPLTDIGNHARGTVFLDGSRHVTPALEESIDRIAKSFDGFFFGRFDLRAQTVEDFRQGRNFKIVELNGVTSEATHIYDPKYPLSYARKILCEQWRIAFEIGTANRARGVKPPTVLELAKLLIEYEPASEA